MSTDLRRPQIKITVNGVSVESALDLRSPITGSRTGLGFFSPITVTVQFSLIGRSVDESGSYLNGPLGSISLNPLDNKLWQVGNVVTIELDQDDGLGYREPPFGGTTRIVRNNDYVGIDTLYGESFQPVERLTLTCECALKAQIGPQRSQNPYFVTVEDPKPLNELFQQYADLRGIETAFSVTPPRQINVVLGTNQQGDSLVTFWSQLYVCSPPGEGQFYQIYANNQNKIDARLIDFNAAPTLDLLREDIPGLQFGLDGQTPQLYGFVQAEGVELAFESKRDPEPEATDDNGFRTLTEYFCPTFADPTYRKRVREWQPLDTFIPGASDTQEILSSDTRVRYEYDVTGRVDRVTEITHVPRLAIDTDSLIQAPSFGRRKITTLDREPNGRIKRQKVIESAAWGLIANADFPIPTGVSPTVETLHKIEVTTWKALDNGNYDVNVTTMDRVDGRRRVGVQQRASSSSGPPQFDDRPGNENLVERAIFANIPLAFEDVNQPLKTSIFGQGTHVATGQTTFSGRGYHVQGLTTTTISGGTFTASGGTFNGTGHFTNTSGGAISGNFSGKRFVEREFPLNVGNLCSDSRSLELVAQNEARILSGFHYGHQIQLSMRDLPSGYFPLGSIVDIRRRAEPIKDRFMVHSDEWSLNEQGSGYYAIYRCNGLHIALVDSDTQNVTFNNSFVSNTRIFENREPRVFENQESRVFENKFI